MGFEESLIRYAAPTLAGVKVSTLYNHRFQDLRDCRESIRKYNHQLNHKGLFIELMRHDKDFYLLYVYREKQLWNILNNKDIRLFLKEYGHFEFEEKNNALCYINLLKERLEAGRGFPHEMGIFLGYPLADVKEFIVRNGEDCALCGDWKVYHDVQSAKCFFCKLKKIREVYWKVYCDGRSLKDMIV